MIKTLVAMGNGSNEGVSSMLTAPLQFVLYQVSSSKLLALGYRSVMPGVPDVSQGHVEGGKSGGANMRMTQRAVNVYRCSIREKEHVQH